jgi:hypothetical protein
MTKLTDMITNLLLTSNKPQEEFLQPGDGPLDDYLRKSEILDAMLEEIKELAREENTLVGRTVQFQVADSHAVYVVTHVLENKGQVIVQWVNYDECYIDDRLGRSGTLDLGYVRKTLQWQDQMERARA